VCLSPYPYLRHGRLQVLFQFSILPLEKASCGESHEVAPEKPLRGYRVGHRVGCRPCCPPYGCLTGRIPPYIGMSMINNIPISKPINLSHPTLSQRERVGCIMRLTIEKLVYGGSGFARTDQGVVFVPRSAPGDVLEVEIVQKKKDYATARIIKILQPSPDRQEPDCPTYATAGCCHWQHIRYDRQVEYKEAIIRETLRRVGHFEWEGAIERLTAPDRNYRLRATFHVTNGRLGFLRENTNVIVPIRECPSLVPELNQFIGSVDPGPAREVHAISAPEVARSFVFADGTIQRSGRATIHVGENRYRITADTFFQANRFLLPAMNRKVLEQAGPSPGNVLELYAGVGFFSIPLARAAKEVIAVESSRFSVRLARENARSNQTWPL